MTWTTVEEMLVRQLWSSMPSSELSVLLGRPAYQVRNRAASLGLGGTGTCGRRYGQLLVDHILKLYSCSTVEQVAAMMDMTPGQIEGIVKRARQSAIGKV